MHSKFNSPLRVPISKNKNFILNLNNYRNTHYQSLNKAKINYKEMIKDQLHDKVFNCPIQIEYQYFPGTKRLTDIGNVVSIHQKFFEDALSELGCIPDDNYKYVPSSVCSFGGIDKENPRVEITIKELL